MLNLHEYSDLQRGPRSHMSSICKTQTGISAFRSTVLALRLPVVVLSCCLAAFVLIACTGAEPIAETPPVAAPFFSQSDLDRVADAINGRDEFWRNYGSEVLRAADASHFSTNAAQVSQAWELVRSLYQVPPEILDNFPDEFTDHLAAFDEGMNSALSLWLSYGYENQNLVASPFIEFHDWQEINYNINDENEAREIYDREATAHYRNDPTRTPPSGAIEAMPTQEDIDWLIQAADDYQSEMRAYLDQ